MKIAKENVGTKKNGSSNSSLLALQSAALGRRPNGQAESNLVDEIRQVVDQVQGVVVDASQQVAEEVAQGIDGPTDGHNEAHHAEGLLNILVHLVTACGNGTGL